MFLKAYNIFKKNFEQIFLIQSIIQLRGLGEGIII